MKQKRYFTAILSGPADVLDKVRQRYLGLGHPVADEQDNHGWPAEEGTEFLTLEDESELDLDALVAIAEPYGWVLRSHGQRVARDPEELSLLDIGQIDPTTRLALAEQLLASLKEA